MGHGVVTISISVTNQSSISDSSSLFTFNHARIFSNFSMLLRLPAVSMPHRHTKLFSRFCSKFIQETIYQISAESTEFVEYYKNILQLTLFETVWK